MVDKEVLHKEIDLIQGVINRMTNNSFLLKGWLVSLIVVVLALERDVIGRASLILLFPTIAFWFLDAFFLRVERCYQKLYEWVIENRSKTDDFLYSLNYRRFEKSVHNTIRIMFSKTLLLFYGVILAILMVLLIINK